MARMPGLLRSRQKVAEVELDQSLVAARLADIFGLGTTTDVANPPHGEKAAQGGDAAQPDAASQPHAAGPSRRSTPSPRFE